MIIKSLPVIMHFDYKKNKVKIEIVETFTYTNSRDDSWRFGVGWLSDGHSTGKYFKHFDAWTLAALCHDLDCERSNDLKSHYVRREGDKNYKFNLADLGAPKAQVNWRYAAVSARTRWLKLMGRIN